MKFLKQEDVDREIRGGRYTLHIVIDDHGMQLARLIFMEDGLAVQHCRDAHVLQRVKSISRKFTRLKNGIDQ